VGVALAGKVVLVTGSSRGIGAAVARQAAAEGAQVAVHYRAGAEQAERVVAEARAAAGADARAFQADLRDGDAAERLVGQVVQTFGRLDGLVNNAGMDQRGPTLELAPDEWDAVIATNLTATFRTMQAAIPVMLDQGRETSARVAERKACPSRERATKPGNTSRPPRSWVLPTPTWPCGVEPTATICPPPTAISTVRPSVSRALRKRVSMAVNAGLRCYFQSRRNAFARRLVRLLHRHWRVLGHVGISLGPARQC